MKIEEVKRSLNKTVIRSTGAGSFPYLFTGCVLRKCDLGYYYQAELQDPNNKNSVLVLCRDSQCLARIRARFAWGREIARYAIFSGAESR